MLANPELCPSPPRRALRGASGHLRDALLALAGCRGAIVRHAERPWASVTFEGTRHTIELRFDGTDAAAAGEMFIECVPDHDFAIPGHLVAEARVTEVDQRLAPTPRLAVTCELLLLKDC